MDYTTVSGWVFFFVAVLALIVLGGLAEWMTKKRETIVVMGPRRTEQPGRFWICIECDAVFDPEAGRHQGGIYCPKCACASVHPIARWVVPMSTVLPAGGVRAARSIDKRRRRVMPAPMAVGLVGANDYSPLHNAGRPGEVAHAA